MILQRTAHGVSFVPTLAVLLQRDTVIFMGNSPVSKTWPETSVYSNRKQRYCVGGCCSQLHKIPAFVGVDWNSLVLASAALQGKEWWQVCDNPAALTLSPAVTAAHRAPSPGLETQVELASAALGMLSLVLRAG